MILCYISDAGTKTQWMNIKGMNPSANEQFYYLLLEIGSV